MTQTTTSKLLLKQLVINSTLEQKAKIVLANCKTLNYTRNKAGNLITIEGLTRLSKAMLRDIKNSKKGWWSTYEIKTDEKDNVSISLIKTVDVPNVAKTKDVTKENTTIKK